MKLKLLLVLLVLSVVPVGYIAACDPPKPETTAYLPAVKLVLSGVEVAAAPGIEQSLAPSNPSLTKCATWVAFRSAAGALREYLAAVERSGKWAALPAELRVDYGACVSLQRDGAYRAVLPQKAGPLVFGVGEPLLEYLDETLVQPAVRDANIEPGCKAFLSELAPWLRGLLCATLRELAEPDGSFVYVYAPPVAAAPPGP